MALTHDWSALEESAHKESPKQLRAKLEALDWSALSIAEDLPPLRRVLQRLEQRFGVRPTHRWATRLVCEKAESVHAEHGYVHLDGAITGVAMSPDGRFLATCNEYDMDTSSTESGTMGLWDVAGARLVAHSDECPWGLGQRYGSGPGQLQWSPNGEFVYAVQPSANGVLWSLRDGDFLGQTEALADSGIGSTVHAYWTADGQLAYQLGPIREKPFELLEPSVEEPLLIESLRALGGGEGARDEEDQLGVGGWFTRAHFSAALPRAVCVCSTGAIYIVDTDSGRVIEWHADAEQRRRSGGDETKLSTRVAEGAITHRAAHVWKAGADDADAPLSPDGRTFVCVRDGKLCAVDLETQRVRVVLSPSPDRVHDVQWDRTGERVAVASGRSVQVFSVERATRLAKIAIDTRPPRCSNRRIYDRSVCAFSRGATLFALVDTAGVIHFYDADFREISAVKARKRASSIAWGAGDATLVSWGEGVIEFWDTRGLWSGAPVRRLGRNEQLGQSESKPSRSWSAAEKRYRPEYGGAFNGPALDEPTGEPWQGGGLRGLVESNLNRVGGELAFFSVPGEETFAMFAFYRVKESRALVLACRPEHAARVLATSAVVVNSFFAWPLAWAAGTQWCSVVHTWRAALALGAPAVANWSDSVLQP